MSDWIHCNKCSLKYGRDNQSKFYLVECGHLLCQRCVERIRPNNQCIICGKSGQVLLLSKDVEQNVMDYFLPLENYHKKTIEIYKFQIQHRNCLFQNLLQKYNYAKKEYVNLTSNNKKLQKENQMLRSMLRSSGQNMQGPYFSSSTPVSAHSPMNVTFQNTSMMSSIPPGAPPSRDLHTPAAPHPGYARRVSMFNPKRPSPVQREPFFKLPEPVPIHRTIPTSTAPTMYSFDQLRRGVPQ